MRFMRYFLTFAAIGVAVLHGWFGRLDTMLPSATYQTPAVGTTIAACWHFITVFFLVSAVVFFRGGFEATRFGALWFVFGLIFLILAPVNGGFAGFISSPQWLPLLLVGGLALKFGDS